MNKKNSFFIKNAHILTNQLGTKILSILVAIILWGVVLGSRNIEITKDIPLEILNSSEMIASNEIPDRVAFRLSGPKAFLRSILDRREDPIQINLIGAKPSLITYRLFSDNIRLPIGVKVLSIHPASILIQLETVKRREVPLKVELRGLPAEGYRVSGTKIQPDRVWIRGPETKIANIDVLSIIPIDVSNAQKSFEKKVTMDVMHHSIRFEGEVPLARVEIEPIETHFKIKNLDVQVMASYPYRIDQPSMSLIVRATPKDMETLDHRQIYGLIDLRGKGRGKYTEIIKVTLPQHLTLIKVIPEKVTIVLY